MAKVVRKIGAWSRVRNIVFNLGNDMEKSRRICLSRWGLKIEGMAKTHISTQDLPWVALNKAYKADKVSKGYSDKILLATSAYFQNITSWHNKSTVYVGVKKTAMSPEGKILHNIARLLEYGHNKTNLPARPLWRPVHREGLLWLKKQNSPSAIFLSFVSKR